MYHSKHSLNVRQLRDTVSINYQTSGMIRLAWCADSLVDRPRLSGQANMISDSRDIIYHAPL